MKKLMTIALLLVGMTAQAQEYDKEKIINYVDSLIGVGFHEDKKVVNVENTKANVLFGRAMEALSDWTGENGRSSAGLDYQDKETATIIYKGRLWLGEDKNINMYANFTMKVRCKDDKAQITMMVASFTYTSYSFGVRNYSLVELCGMAKEYLMKKKKIKNNHKITNLKKTCEMVMNYMAMRIATPPDDDF